MADLEMLAAKARDGDRDAFTELVARTYTDTFTLAYRLTGSDADASDVVQDAYVRAFKSISKFRGDAKFTTWLFRITANCASTHMSRRSKDHHLPLADDHIVLDTSVAHNPQSSIDNDVLHGRLVEALESLPKAMREVVVLRDVYDLTHEAIAGELNISVTAAKVRLHRARRKLRNIVSGLHEDTAPDSVSSLIGAIDGNEMVESGVEADEGENGKDSHAM